MTDEQITGTIPRRKDAYISKLDATDGEEGEITLNIMISGLDMAPTVVAYSNQSREIRQIIQERIKQRGEPILTLTFPIANLNLLLGQMYTDGVCDLFGLFPEPARALMRVGELTGLPSRWFHKDSVSKPRATWCVERALGATFVCPSYTEYAADINNRLDCTIELYRIPDCLCDFVIGEIILSQAFVHELVHTIAAPVWHEDFGPLRFPDGRVVGAEECILEFGQLVQDLGCGPISHYSEGYWRDDRKRLVLTKEIDEMDAAWQTPIMEEFCETVAAHLLGFAMHPSGLRIGNPLSDRPQVGKWIEQFLGAVPVNG